MERNQSLDVLRAAAVLAVIGHHSTYYPLWEKVGWIGVDLFFVLSGFLISGLLFREYKNTGEIKISRFLLRRGLKIWPSYYLLLVGVSLVYLLAQRTDLQALKPQLISNFLFVQNYFPGSANIILGHTWTLAVEEHFYLMLPILLFLFINSGRRENPFRALPLLALGVAFTCLLLRLFTLQKWEAAQATHLHIDGLFGGVALSYIRHFKSEWFNRLTGNYAPLFAAMFVSPAFLLEQTDPRMQHFGLTSLAIGFVFLVAWSVVRTPRSIPMRTLFAAAARIGLYSYSIYLWHTMIVILFLTHAPITFFKFWTYVIGSVTAGIAMAHLVEIPYLRMRDRLFPSDTSGTAAASD